MSVRALGQAMHKLSGCCVSFNVSRTHVEVGAFDQVTSSSSRGNLSTRKVRVPPRSLIGRATLGNESPSAGRIS